MKSIILSLIVLFLVDIAYSQKIILHRNTGGDQTYYLSSIDSITFVPFTCGDSIGYERKTYGTVLIGAQCWLKENLNVGSMLEGTSIQTTNSQTDNGIIEKYCYENDTANCSIYGGLYQWNEAMQYVTTSGAQGICPDGWHIPSYEEFQTLYTQVGGSANALKAIGNGTGNNSSGFSALSAGYLHTMFAELGTTGFIWSSTQINPAEATYLYMYAQNDFMSYYNNWNWYGVSVRCLKN